MYISYKLLFIFGLIAITHAYNIKYTGYKDNKCSAVDDAVTGQIFSGVCAPEYRSNKFTTGKITFINEQYLTSCDYSDIACETQTVCQNYTNGECSSSSSVSFSNKYSWSLVNGAWVIMYTSYTDTNCNSKDVSGQIFENKCSPEFVGTPQSGKITFINDEYLTSCDYSDANCEQQIICENYTNFKCYGSAFTAFSNMYSWNVETPTSAPTSAPSQPTSAPSQPTSAPTSAPSKPTTAPTTPGSEFTIMYTAYQDNHCDAVDNGMSGQIFAYTCAPEFRKVPQSGMITFVNEEYLTSCDYSDVTCSTQTVCENYTRDACYPSSTVNFANKYSWSLLGNGQWGINYTSFWDKSCSSLMLTSFLQPQVCGEEYREKPQSGKITAITDTWLMSCDYSDTNCEQLTVCENYTNNFCYGSSVTSFSNKYSWKRNSGSQSGSNPLPTSAPSSGSSSQPTGSGSKSESNSATFRIAYVGYNDNTCTNVDNSVTGEIFAYKCAPEYRNAPQSGKIVFINMDYLISCDYNDMACTDVKVCENYTNSVCYDSASSAFSNKYSWTENADGGFAITYSSYKAKSCAADQLAVSGDIFEGVCSAEVSKQPSSGMITFINDEYLTSCDYSDTECKNLILCENYNNTQCYGSPVTSFSQRYVWARSSSATVAASLFLVFAAVAIALF